MNPHWKVEHQEFPLFFDWGGFRKAHRVGINFKFKHMKFVNQPHYQNILITGGTVLDTKLTKAALKKSGAPSVSLCLAGERGRVAGTGIFPAGKGPYQDFTVNGSIHHIGSQTIIALRAYEWHTLIGSITIVLDAKKKGFANYKLKFAKVWRVEKANAKVVYFQPTGK